MLTSFIPMMIVYIAKGPTGMECNSLLSTVLRNLLGLVFIVALKEKFYHPILKLTNLSLRDFKDLYCFITW